MKIKRFIKLCAVCLATAAIIALAACSVSAASSGSVVASLGGVENRTLSGITIQPASGEMGKWSDSVDGDSIKLDYSAHKVFGAYRVMFFFNANNALAGRTWVTVTYKTNTTEKADLVYASNAGAYVENPLWGVNLVTLCDDVSVSGGEWVTTEPFCLDIKDSQILPRLNMCSHNTLYFTIEGQDAEVYVKEMRFFNSEREAKNYHENLKNASASTNTAPFIADMSTYENMRKTVIQIIGDYNAASYDKTEGAFKLNYYDDKRPESELSYNRLGTGAYGMRFQFVSRKELSPEHKYICVTYKTDCSGKYSLKLTDADWRIGLTLTDDISASAGQYVTTAPAKLSSAMLEYILAGKDLWIVSDTLNRNVNLNIREIAFFTTAEDAMKHYNMTTASKPAASITIEGTPISDYTVIIPAGDEKRLEKVTTAIVDAVKAVTGKEIAVKTDAEPAGQYEILVGTTNRPESALLYDAKTGKFGSGEYMVLDFGALTANGKLVIGADLYAGTEQTIGQFLNAYITDRVFDFKNGFEVSSVIDERPYNGPHFKNYDFDNIEKSFETPNTYADDFDDETAGTNPNYWTEDPIDLTGYASGSVIGRKIDFTSYDKFTENGSINSDVLSSASSNVANNKFDAWIGSWQFEDGHVKLNSRGGMTQGGAYRMAFNVKSGIVTNDWKYMTVTYKVNAPEDAVGKIEIRMADESVTVMEGLKSTNGEFVTSTPADISTNGFLFSRWKAGLPHNALCFNFGSISTGIDVFVKEVTFFNDLETAKKYASGELTELEPKASPTTVSDKWMTAADGVNKVYAVKTDKLSFSWLHTSERDIDLTAKIKLVNAGATAKAGLACRINDDLAYVIAGYDAKEGKWFIESRQGEPYMTHRTFGEAASVETGKWYTLRLVAEGAKVALYVDGGAAPVVSVETMSHRSPGKAGLFAEDAEVMFDDASIILTSCQSRVQDGVITMTLPLDGFAEGGTVLPINNGEDLLFLHQDYQLVSKDMGLSWEKTYWAKIVQHANVYRLDSGKIIRLEEITVDNVAYYAATLTEDEGKTWSEPKIIAPMKWNKTTGSSCIMNDKFMQMSDGRLFFSCTYNGVNGNSAHVEMYYSDDEGLTWTKSKTSSMDVYDKKGFAESKIVETSKGKLRMLTSWNSDHCMTYNESSDNGVTWGPTVLMEDFKCSCSSSDIFRDPETGTYYMVWVYNHIRRGGMPRARLALAMSTDGINWQYCMDVDRWDSPIAHENGTIAHIVDPFVKVVGDYVFVGTGFAETLGDYHNQYHKGQIERLYRIEKDKIVPYDIWPNAN